MQMAAGQFTGVVILQGCTLNAEIAKCMQDKKRNLSYSRSTFTSLPCGHLFASSRLTPRSLVFLFFSSSFSSLRPSVYLAT